MDKVKKVASEIIGEETIQVKSRFFYLVAFLTILYLGIQIYAFIILKDKPTIRLPYQFTTFVGIAIFAYMVIKETLKWTGLGMSEHYGEYLSHLIIATYISMIVISFFSPQRFPNLPEDFAGFTLSVFLTLVGSVISKIVRKYKHAKKESYCL